MLNAENAKLKMLQVEIKNSVSFSNMLTIQTRSCAINVHLFLLLDIFTIPHPSCTLETSQSFIFIDTLSTHLHHYGVKF